MSTARIIGRRLRGRRLSITETEICNEFDRQLGALREVIAAQNHQAALGSLTSSDLDRIARHNPQDQE
jgi:hypothetical protein